MDVFYAASTEGESIAVQVDGRVRSVSVHDFNGDDRPDVLVEMAQRPVVLLSNSAGRLIHPTGVLFAFNSSPVVAGDFSGDEVTDMVIPTISGVTIVRGTGDGGFEFPRELDPALRSPIHTIGDVNRDGLDDVVFRDEDSSRAGFLNLALNDGQGAFTLTRLPLQFDCCSTPTVHISEGDIVTIRNIGTMARLHVFSGGVERFTYESPLVPIIRHVPSAAYLEARTADLDGDGVNEIALIEGRPDYGKTLKVFSGRTHALLLTFDAGVHAGADLLMDDIDGDGHLDLLLTSSGTPQFGAYSMWSLPDGSVRLFSGNGDGTFAAPLTIASGFSPGKPSSGDFNADGRRDLIYETDGAAMVQYAAGGGFPAPAVLAQIAGLATTVEVRDLNADGLDDVVASHGGAEIELLFGSRTGLNRRAMHKSTRAIPARLTSGGPISLLVPYHGLYVLDSTCIPAPARRRGARS